MENWKAIPEYENYEVSDLGNVRNLRTGRMLKLGKNPQGYLIAGLYRNGKRKPFSIHQLVAIVFLGHIPNGNTITVDHVNGCKTDNRLENLELVTQRENTIRGIAKQNTSSQFPGVSWFKRDKKWKAQIRINGKKKFLGYFTNELEAAAAYEKALEDLNRIQKDLDPDLGCPNTLGL